jgi:hypothetical protein
VLWSWFVYLWIALTTPFVGLNDVTMNEGEWQGVLLEER